MDGRNPSCVLTRGTAVATDGSPVSARVPRVAALPLTVGKTTCLKIVSMRHISATTRLVFSQDTPPMRMARESPRAEWPTEKLACVSKLTDWLSLRMWRSMRGRSWRWRVVRNVAVSGGPAIAGRAIRESPLRRDEEALRWLVMRMPHLAAPRHSCEGRNDDWRRQEWRMGGAGNGAWGRGAMRGGAGLIYRLTSGTNTSVPAVTGTLNCPEANI